MKHLQVACAIIEQDGKVLCTQRSETMSLPLKWEFPGGKINEGEKPEACLKRELHEELGIEVAMLRPLFPVSHQYPAFVVTLYPFICKITSGEIKLHEHKAFTWLPPDKLRELEWAEADLPVIENYRFTMLKRSPYSATIEDFRKSIPDEIIGQLTQGSINIQQTQTHAWLVEINMLQAALKCTSRELSLQVSSS